MAETMHEKMMRLHKTGGENGSQSKLLSYEVALRDKKLIAERTFAFTFDKPRGFQFAAGQHIRITLIDPPETDKEGDSRFWSIASMPSDKYLVIAMRMRNTAYKRVLSSMAVGSKVQIQIRQHTHDGAFILHDDPARPAVFLIGGIGIVPAFSIITDALNRKLLFKITLLYSNRRPEDAPFLNDLQKLAKLYSNFTFVPTMTDAEKSSQSWRGNLGRINRTLIKKYVPDMQNPVFYIAGLSEMVKTMQSILAKADVSDKNIRAEEYAGFTNSHTGEGASRNPKSKIITLSITFLVLSIIALHLLAGSSIVKAGYSQSNITKQFLAILVLAMVILVIIKIKLIKKHKWVKKY